jgi:hypothetical protein
MILRTGALATAVALGVWGALGNALAAFAQMNCQTVQTTTTQVTNPPTVTPLDAIAFPTTLRPQPGPSVVRQTVICPPATTLPPGLLPPPAFIGAPAVLGAPVYAPPSGGMTGGGPGTGPAGAPLAPPYPYAAGTVPKDTVRDLATRGAAYDRAVVTVNGTAGNVVQTTDAGGHPLTAFTLQAEGAAVDVVAWGRLNLAPGEPVRVSGPFYVSSPFQGAGGRSWHNVIDAQSVDQ